MSKCGETSSYGFPVLYSYGQYKCTAASLGIDKMKKLVKIMKPTECLNMGRHVLMRGDLQLWFSSFAQFFLDSTSVQLLH